MEAQISGNNVNETLEQMKAQNAAIKAAGLENLPPVELVANPTSSGQVQSQTNPPKPDAVTEGNKVEVPQQFRDKEGKLDEDKVLKSNEHLEKAIQSKAERQAKILKEHKELQEKFRQSSEETKRLESEVASNPMKDLDLENMSPEFRQKLMKDFEDDFIGTQIKLQKALLHREFDKQVKPLHSQVREIHEKTREKSGMDELDGLIEDGHAWIADEGLGRFEQVFKERPYLLQSPTKYRDAVRFMDVPFAGNGASGSAQTRNSPILGANRAVPPPSQTPPASPESTMAELDAQILLAMKAGNMSLAKQLQDKARDLHRMSSIR